MKYGKQCNKVPNDSAMISNTEVHMRDKSASSVQREGFQEEVRTEQSLGGWMNEQEQKSQRAEGGHCWLSR